MSEALKSNISKTSTREIDILSKKQIEKTQFNKVLQSILDLFYFLDNNGYKEICGNLSTFIIKKDKVVNL